MEGTVANETKSHELNPFRKYGGLYIILGMLDIYFVAFVLFVGVEVEIHELLRSELLILEILPAWLIRVEPVDLDWKAWSFPDFIDWAIEDLFYPHI